MKKFLSITLIVVIALFFTACSNPADQQKIAELEAEISSLKEEYNITDSDSNGNNEKEEAATTTQNPVLKEYEEYLKENNVTLTNTDVKYDMANSVDKLFEISGVAELSDYYNWGFDRSIESKYFCLEVTPEGGGYTDRWYIYCNRSSLGGLLDKAKAKGKIYIKAVCKIPKAYYEKNQQCQAMLEYVIY